MKRVYFLLVIVLSFFFVSAQETTKFSIKGTIKDSETGEALIGASVIAKPGVGAVADLDGNYELMIEPGTYNLKINYVGYAPQSIKAKVVDKDIIVNILLENQTLDEVEITANIGTVRETPVAITNISQQKIQEELGARDLPMLLNSTPGVYASQQGGGYGDSRITIRGFDQANIAVMVDGVPVNDMENGAVFWSNWDGLSEITKTMQVQRGLGATKLAVSSAGGTMNIITNGIDQKQQTVIKRDYGNNNYQRTSLGYNSGLIKNKFGIVFAGSYRTGDGIIDGTFIQAWSYFVKFQYKPNSRHLLSLSANGAPQIHGQRNTKTTVGVFSQEYASMIGIDDPNANMVASGLRNPDSPQQPRNYNYEVAKLNGEDYYVSTNFYHKPLINLSHFWTASEKLTISSVAYASIGTGGGGGLNTAVPLNKDLGYVDLTSAYISNQKPPSSNDKKYYSPYLHHSSKIMRASMNDHKWVGLLSTAILKLDTGLTFTFGVDARYYVGSHYRKVTDLLGGDYFTSTACANCPSGTYDPFHPTYIDPNYQKNMKVVGDTIDYNYRGVVNWGGLFSQIEYKKDNWTLFGTLTGSYTGYQRIDHYAKMDLTVGPENKGLKKFVDYFKDARDPNVIESCLGFGETALVVDANNYIVYNNTKQTTYNHGDTTFVVSYNTNTTIPKDTAYIVGATAYTIDSKEAKFARTRKQWFPGYTIKGGANYKINTHWNVYANIGALSMAPKFNNVYNQTGVGNRTYADTKNNKIYSQEIGLGVKYSKFAANMNMYYTIWKNRPLTPITLNDNVYQINGLDASFAGIEFDWDYKINKWLEWESTKSFGNWIYTSGSVVYSYDVYTGAPSTDPPIDFSAKGVHIGNAAQIQYSDALRFNIGKGLYIKPRYTYFAKNYADFRPTDLSGNSRDKGSWRIASFGMVRAPDLQVLHGKLFKTFYFNGNMRKIYGLIDFNAGYDFKFEGLKLNINASVTNLFNNFYIADALNNGYGTQNYDANSATVFIGMGRQYKIGLRATF